MNAAHRDALTSGWYAAAFTRQKTIKPLAELLAPPRKKGGGNARAAAMFRRLAEKQKQGQTDGNG